MSRTRLVILAGALALVAALAPILQHQHAARHGALDVRLATAETAGPTVVTRAMRAEIDRVVDAAPAIAPRVASRLTTLTRTATNGLTPRGRAAAAATSGATPARTARAVITPLARTLATDLVRCATFDGQRYCLGDGWTDRSATQVRSSVVGAITQAARTPNTGDLGPVQTLLQRAHQTPAARAAAERTELTDAARSVAKVWLLRHEIQGVPLPAGFLRDHPEAAVPVTGNSAALSAQSTYPAEARILNVKRVAAQERTYWCGVASMQMIAWNWQQAKKHTQSYWAGQLGTTREGTSITSLVNQVNKATGYDNKAYAGKYIVLDISGWSYAQWFTLIEKHISKYHAPVVLHPILLKKYFPYLAYNASGHFQVGRGYQRRPRSYNLISYFEPWNQQRFDPSEPYIARVQWRSAYKSYRANEDHFQHDIGV